MSVSFERSDRHCFQVVVAVPDFPLLRGEQMNRRDGDFQIAGAVGNEEELLESAARIPPDVALVDLELPASGGLSAALRLLATCPQTKVIMTTSDHRADSLKKVIQTGLHGYLLAPVAPEMLANAVSCVIGGGAIFPHALASAAVGLRSTEEREAALRARCLTKRERQLLGLIVEGLRSKEIAERLVVSRHTVRTHLYNLYRKLQVHSRDEAIQFAVRYEVVEASDGDMVQT